MMLINIPIFARLIEDEINELNESFSEDKQNIHIWVFRFRNLLRMHQEMTEWVKLRSTFHDGSVETKLALNNFRFLTELDDYFFKVVFAQITTSELGAIPVIYIILTVPTYFPAYTVAIYILSSLFIFCTFGHLIEKTV